MARTARMLALLVALAVAGWARAETTVEVVLDVSASNWQRFGDAPFGFVALREVVNQLACEIPASQPDLRLGLRLCGGHLSHVDEGACGDTSLAVPVGGLDRAALLEAVEGLEPRGATGIGTALREALEDVRGGTGRRLVVLVTDGVDSCDASLEGGVEGLAREDGIELRIVALSLPDEAAAALAPFAAIENVRSVEELAMAVRCVLADVFDPPPDQQVEISLLRAGESIDDGGVELINTLSGEVIPLGAVSGSYRGTIEPAGYAVRVDDVVLGGVLFDGLLVSAGEETRCRLELEARAEVSIEVEPDEAQAGSPVTVRFSGAPQGPAWITLALVGTGGEEYLVSRRVEGPSGEAELITPDVGCRLEARYHQELDSGCSRVIGRAEFLSHQAEATVTAADQGYTDNPITVEWQGPGGRDDVVAIVPTDAPEGALGVWRSTDDGSPLDLVAPGVPGGHEVRYVSGLSGRTLAKAGVQLVVPEATLEGPDEVRFGSTFGVEWTGPEAMGDYVTIVAAGAADGEYLSFSDVSVGSPATLTAPSHPGEYEVRYVSGADGRTLWREPVMVVGLEVSVTPPPVVDRGARFPVPWTGPAATGDYLTIVPEGAPEGARPDAWAYTSEGSPLTLPAPETAGSYEVRYVTGGTGQTLASAPVTVR